MNLNSNSWKFFVVAMVGAMLSCAGSAPDYAPLKRSPAQEEKLARFFDQSEAPESTQTIVAPVCPTTVTPTRTGWSLDAGDWCIISCETSAGTTSQWHDTPQGTRCLSGTAQKTATYATAEFIWSDLSLKSAVAFSRFSRSFLRDTEWHCKEYRYHVDPENRRGFWHAQDGSEQLYRFHRSGKLVTGSSAENAWPSGNWQVTDSGQVFFNQRRVFKYAVRDSGNRFDNFTHSRQKQVCRFYGEVPQAAAASAPPMRG